MNRPKFFRLTAWTAVACWAATVFILSSLSGPQVEELNVFSIWDKALHFSAFLPGAAVLAIALRLSTAWPWKKVLLVAIAAISLFGASDEVHQLFTPSRSALDLGDWTADTLGAIAGAALTYLVHALTQRKNRPAPAAA